jgi:hypothetical protein
VAIGGTLNIFGTATGHEHPTLTRGPIGLDPSFNQGGDTIGLPGAASAFTAASPSGSNVNLVGAGLTVAIPVGTAPTTLHFADGDRTLVYDTALQTILIGSQHIGADAVALGAIA